MAKKQKKPKSVSKYKRELDKVFSLYIRSVFPSECYTCGNKSANLQCGHFVSRSYLATRWEVNNCRPQCVGCNIYGGGKPLDFEEHLIKDIGRRAVDKLKAKRHEVVKLKVTDYERLIQKYKSAPGDTIKW